MSDKIIKLDDGNWEKKIEKGQKPCIVMFTSPTCPYCMQMKPSFEEYADEYKERIVFAEVDISQSPTIASRYGVMGTPTFKFFCNGKPVHELVGAIYPHLIKKAIEEVIEHGSSCVNNTTWVAPEISPYT